MYKKLLSFKRKSTDKTHMLNVEEATACEKRTEEEHQSGIRADPYCCFSCCRCCPECCAEDRCPRPLCRLCVTFLIRPSCVGAIRALQNIPNMSSVKPNCCQAGSKWIPDSESLAIQKLQIVSKTRCCC